MTVVWISASECDQMSPTRPEHEMDRHSDGGSHAGLDSAASAPGDDPAAADAFTQVSRTPQAGDFGEEGGRNVVLGCGPGDRQEAQAADQAATGRNGDR